METKEAAMLKLFVRWNKEGEGYDTVELMNDGTVIQTHTFCNNRERLYGWCTGAVDTMKRLGFQLSMPACLQGHLTYNLGRED